MIRNIFSKTLTRNIKLNSAASGNVIFRCYVTPPKRFYKNAGLIQSDGKYEITLDQRKLKTPKGSPFHVESEPLALAIAAEWSSQKDVIERSRMMLTALSNTAIDNPNNFSKTDLVNYLLTFAETDTILFHNKEEEELYKLQTEQWDPIIEWFNKRYSTELRKTEDISPPLFPTDAKMKIGNYLMSYNLPALHGIQFAVDTLKSVILTFACIDRFITPDKAVLLSRLEEEFQLGHWGRVEWAHDLNQQDLQARLAASIFFIHCNSFSYFVKSKNFA